jgi:hypothetical protein
MVLTGTNNGGENHMSGQEIVGSVVYDAVKTRCRTSDAKKHVEEVLDALAMVIFETINSDGIMEIPGVGLVGGEGTEERVKELNSEEAFAERSARKARRESKAKADSAKKQERPKGKAKVPTKATPKAAAAKKTAPTTKKATAKKKPVAKATGKVKVQTRGGK